MKEKKNVEKETKCKKGLNIIIGNSSALDISDVGDCVNDLKPKSNSTSKKIIPTNKK